MPDPSTQEWLLLGALIGVLLAWIVLRGRGAATALVRRRQLQRAAHRAGFQTATEEVQDLVRTLDALNPEPGGGRSVSPRLRNVYRGRCAGLTTYLFDHEIQVAAGRSPHTTVLFEIPGLTLPPFELLPSAPAGAEDLADANPQQGLTRYRLRTTATLPAAYRARLESLVLELAADPVWHLAGGANHVALFQPGRRVEPDELEKWVERCRQRVECLRRT